MNYLIFRTDRIGDFLITAPLIQCIKRNDKKAKIFIVASNKNDKFIVQYNLVHEVFTLKSNKFIDRIKLYFKLKKFIFNTVIIADKKNRSILMGILLKSNIKIFNVGKNIQKRILNFFYKNVFYDTSNIIKTSKDNIIENCKVLNFNLIDEDFYYLKKNQLKDSFLHQNHFNLDQLSYIVFHYDEKWELEQYKQLYNKADALTDITPNLDKFKRLILKISKLSNKTIIITTGYVQTKLLSDLIGSAKKIDQFLYEVNLDSIKIYIIVKQDFFSNSHIISKSKMLIACHGAFTHMASIYKIKILDIVEGNKINQYEKITSHMINHKFIRRNNFDNLASDITNIF